MKQIAISMFLMGSMIFGVTGISAPEEMATENASEAAETDSASVEASVPQTVCPVMGGAINKDVYADYDGKRVYFCCAPCGDKFAEAPASFVEKLENQGVTLEKVPQPQTDCPITGREIDKKFHVDHEGLRIYACCASCVGQISSDPGTYLEKLEKEGVTLEAVPGAVEQEAHGEDEREEESGDGEDHHDHKHH